MSSPFRDLVVLPLRHGEALVDAVSKRRVSGRSDWNWEKGGEGDLLRSRPVRGMLAVNTRGDDQLHPRGNCTIDAGSVRWPRNKWCRHDTLQRSFEQSGMVLADISVALATGFLQPIAINDPDVASPIGD
jgi:hypothetical protein